MIPHSQRPSIVEVISGYLILKKVGRNYFGLCPFHLDKNPSFTVNEEKGLFYCHGCHEGGDVIRFIELIEGLDFKGALAHLGLNDQPRPTRAKIKTRERVRQASRNLATWALSVSERVGTRMRELGQRSYTARKLLNELPGADKRLLREVIQRDEREWQILSALDEDMDDPEQIANLWADRETIEPLAGYSGTYSNEEIEGIFPPITDAYKQRLVSYVRGEA